LLHRLDQLQGAAAEPQVGQGLVVYREKAHGGPVLRGHVGNGGPNGQRHLVQARPEVLDELAHHAVLAEDLGDAQHQIGGGRALGQAPRQPHPHHIGDEHVDGLAQHDRLGLDAPHPPSHDAEAVDHRGVGVGADERVRIQDAVGVPHDPRQVLEVHLVHDPRGRRHDPEVVEGTLAPLEELVAFPVAFELLLTVDRDGGSGVERVHLHRMIDHQVALHEGIDLPRIAAHPDHGAAHGGQIDHGRYAREVLEHDPPRREGDLGPARPGRVVPGQGSQVVLGHDLAVEVAET
jgi:hypothetical protein